MIITVSVKEITLLLADVTIKAIAKKEYLLVNCGGISKYQKICMLPKSTSFRCNAPIIPV